MAYLLKYSKLLLYSLVQLLSKIKSVASIGLAFFAALVSLFSSPALLAQDYPYQPVDFTKVQLTDHFWKPKVETNAKVTIPYILKMCKEHGRIDNFLKAAGRMPAGEKMTTYPFDDTDIYKLIEGASYSLQTSYNPLLDRQLDSLIEIIGAAQEPDG